MSAPRRRSSGRAMAGAMIGLILAMPAARAAESTSLAYVILKEGQPIGSETVDILRDGPHLQVQVQTKTRVKLLFLNFHYQHSRTENWEGGKLERMVADTDDDGTPHHIDIHRSGLGLVGDVDGSKTTMPPDSLPLTVWGKAILDRHSLTSVVDAEPYRVSISALGPETLRLGNAEVSAEHWRIAGEVERDLWYGPDGLLLKAAFQRKGYPIEIVRN